MDTVKCIVVDDDPLSLQMIRHFVERTNFLELKHQFENAIDAANYLREEHIDLIFLDIRMPEMTGMDLVKSLEDDFEIILVTSETDHALEAIEYNVTDYLVKPIEYPRFIKAVEKARKNLERQLVPQEGQQEIYVKSQAKVIKIILNDILYIEALADYVIINTTSKRHIVHSTMKGIEKKMPSRNFIRVHRSYIVNTDKIEALEDLNIKMGDKFIPIGASFKAAFMDKLNFL